jgi:hypothetical protein
LPDSRWEDRATTSIALTHFTISCPFSLQDGGNQACTHWKVVHTRERKRRLSQEAIFQLNVHELVSLGQVA